MGTPMVIHFYGDEGEVEKTFNQSFVPWKMLKKAVKLAAILEKDDPDESDIDAIAGLVVATFQDRFTVDDLDRKADLTEMLAVVKQIISTAKAVELNPTPPGK